MHSTQLKQGSSSQTLHVFEVWTQCSDAMSQLHSWVYDFGSRGGWALSRDTIDILTDDPGHRRRTIVLNTQTTISLSRTLQLGHRNVQLIVTFPISSTTQALPSLQECVPRVMCIHHPRRGIHPTGYLRSPLL